MKALVLVLAMTFSSLSFAGECFNSSFVQGWDYDHSRDILKIESFRDVYEVETSFCNELAWAHSIGFKSFGGYVCRGDQVVVFNAFGEQVQSCYIDSITKTK